MSLDCHIFDYKFNVWATASPQLKFECAMIIPAACDWNLKQHHSIWLGAAHRLTAGDLLPLAYTASSLGLKLSSSSEQALDTKMPRETPRCKDNPSCVKPYKQSNREPLVTFQNLQPVLPKLLQEILLKALAHAKEKLIGAARLGICVLERFELERTDVIGNLGKAIACGRRIAINNRLLGQCELNGIVQRLGNQSLPVVVIDLNLIELLQILKMVEQKDRNIPSDALNRTSRREHVGVKLGLLVGKRHIFERKILQKDTERCEVLLTFLDVHALVPIVTVKQRREMKGDIPKSLSIQSFEVIRFVSSEPLALFMEHENYEVVLGFGARIARFVYEYGKILHSPHASNNKNAGGKPPAVGGPPCGEDRLLYTTRRFGYSIIAKYEHMFSIVDTNTCSTYRKAA